MNSSLHLSAVGGHTVAGFDISGTTDLLDRAVLILDYLVALNDISTHKANLAVGLHTEELGRGYLSKVVSIDIKLLGERNASGAKLGVLRIVGKIEILGLILGIVGDNYLDRMKNSNSSFGGLVELFSDAVLEKLVINYAVSLCNAGSGNEVENSRRSVSTASEAADGGHSGVVPAVNESVLYELTKISLTHYGVSYVKACKLALLGLGLNVDADIVYNPLIKGSVVLKLDRAKGVSNSLERILNGMCIVVKGINAPLVALSVMAYVNYSVNCRVTHIHIGGCHIDLRTEGLRAVGKLAVLHSLKEVEVLFDRAIAVGAVLAGLGKGASVLTKLFCIKVANVCLAVLDKLYCELVALIKVIGAVENAAGGLASKPGKVAVDAFNVLVVLLRGVGIVVTEVEKAAVLLCGHRIDPDRLCGADVEISVRLGRKTGVDLELGISRKVLVNYIVDKVISDLFHFSVL